MALTARELGWVAVGQPIELHKTQQVVHFSIDLFFAGALVARLHAQAKGHVFKHRHVTEQGVVLKHKTHLTLAHMHMGGVFTAEQNSACIGMFQTRNDAQQGGFAAARWAQQSDQLARVNV